MFAPNCKLYSKLKQKINPKFILAEQLELCTLWLTVSMCHVLYGAVQAAHGTLACGLGATGYIAPKTT
jgi:hypothetical protein